MCVCGDMRGILTEDFHPDSRLPLPVSTGGDTLVRPCVFSPGFVQCEGGGWLIVTGYCYVWSVRFYSVPTWSEPVYVLGNAYNWEHSEEQHVRKQLSKMYTSNTSEGHKCPQSGYCRLFMLRHGLKPVVCAFQLFRNNQNVLKCFTYMYNNILCPFFWYEQMVRETWNTGH